MPADYWVWTEAAPQLGDETVIHALAVLNGKLYGGTANSGRLYEWNGTDAWVEVAPQLGTEIEILGLAVLNDRIYGGTSENGRLYEWNGADAWVEVAPRLGAETFIDSLAVLDGKVYGGTYPNGKLYEWNGSDAWVEVAPQLGAETDIQSLVELDGKLYGGTSPNGRLYEWNGTNAWVEVAPQLGAETFILSLAVLDDKLYGGTAPNGRLYEWNGTNAWVEVAPQLGDATRILSLVVHDDTLYGGTANNGRLNEWNGTDAWVERATQLGDETRIESLMVFNNRIYGGTFPNGKLYELTLRGNFLRLRDSENNLLYTFPDGFHLEKYHSSKRAASSARVLQHGGNVIGDRKYELLHLSLTGTLGAYSLASFETACSRMKGAVDNENVRLYDAYKTDQYFLIKILENADWDFLTDGGIADVNVNFLADPFRHFRDLTVVGPVGLTESGLTQAGLYVTVMNAGDIETLPVITFAAGICQAGISQMSLEIENTNTNKTFYYDGIMLSGDELEVDCENAMVTINGDLGTCNVPGISSFFDLEPGNNYIRVKVSGEIGLSPSIQHSFRQKYF